MDEGLPIAYTVLEKGVPVVSSAGEEVGTVDHVVAAPEQDIFHGVVIATPRGPRFVEADLVASIHEGGVDLKLDACGVEGLPEPHGQSPSFRVDSLEGHPWRALMDRLTGSGPRFR